MGQIYFRLARKPGSDRDRFLQADFPVLISSMSGLAIYRRTGKHKLAQVSGFRDQETEIGTPKSTVDIDG